MRDHDDCDAVAEVYELQEVVHLPRRHGVETRDRLDVYKRQVMSWEADLSSFTERRHTAPDGTELTILSNGSDAYIYVYLEDLSLIHI